MGRIRTIKPEFFRSRSLAAVPVEARLTFAGLWVEADDHGRGVADPRILKGALWPLDDDVTHLHVSAHLDVLAASGHVRLYEADGLTYFEVTNWSAHQSAAYRRGDPKYPAPQGYLTTVSHVSVQESASRTTDRAGREGKGREGINPSVATGVATKPTRTKKAPVYTVDFNLFWSEYPRNPSNGKPGGGGTKLEAWNEWVKLDPDDQAKAIAACGPHARALRKSDTPPKHAHRFLAKREFDDVTSDVRAPDPTACPKCDVAAAQHDDVLCRQIQNRGAA